MLLIERVTEYNNRGSYETGENKKESRGDLVILELLKIFSVGIFFIYILAVGVLGIIAIIRYCRHEREKKFWFMPVISVAAGCFMHYNCIIHDSVFYYHLHGEFMPPADDLGHFFFLSYLAAVYLPWTLVSVIFPIYRNGKTVRKTV